MIGPDQPETRTAARPSDAPGADPVEELQHDLREHLADRRGELLERVHTDLWEPLRRSADQLGALRDEALESEDALRDAGRAVRMLCDELEERGPASELRDGLVGHLDRIDEFAHRVPRVVTVGGAAGSEEAMPARETVRAVLAADYPGALRRALDPEVLVVAPGAAVPPSPADLLRPEDHAGRLTEALDRAERHLRLALEEAADAAVEETGDLLRGRGALDRLRLRWRRSRAPARRRSLEASLDDLFSRAREELLECLEARRFTADLARRERALTEAASAAARCLEEAVGDAGEIRDLADRLERAGRSVASVGGTDREGGGGLEPARLERLESRIRAALERVRAGLPETDRPGTELTGHLSRLVRLSEALSGVGGSGREARTAAARRPADLRDRVSHAVPRVREAVREAGEIVSHGLRAARSESAVREPDPETVSGLVRESCERAARRLRDGAELLEETLGGAAAEVREIPDGILSELRERERREAGAAGWGRTARRLWRTVSRVARRVRRRWAGEPPRRRDGDRGPGAGPRRGAGPGRGEREAEASRPEAGGFEELPAIYRWLFRPEPLDDPHLLVGRGEALEALRALRRRWERGDPAAVAVVGPPGSGKTSLLNCGTTDLESGVPVHRGRVDRRISDAGAAVAWLARFFGVDGEPGAPEELARALEGRRLLVLLENGERLFRREVGGYGALRVLGETVEATEGRIAWVVTFEREPWRVIRSVTGTEGRFGETLALGPLGRRELEEAVLARHRLTGYDLRFVGSGDPERRRGAWFDRLYELSDGSPGRALQIWRECLVATGPHEIHALPPRRPCPGRVPGLEREALFVLAALVQHGDLPEEDLPGLLHATREEVGEHLGPLRREGLIRPVPGLPPPAPLRVDRTAYAEVEARLDRAGLLVPGEEGAR